MRWVWVICTALIFAGCGHTPETAMDDAVPVDTMPGEDVQNEIALAIYDAMGTRDVSFDLSDIVERGVVIVTPRASRYADRIPGLPVRFVAVKGAQNCYLENPNGQAIASWRC